MRIFNAFLIIVAAVFLLLLPIMSLLTSFRTDLRDDTFAYETGAGATSANVTLVKPVYDDDTDTIDITSDDTDDSPTYSSYNTTTRQLNMTGLAASTNRTLTVSYLIDNFEDDTTWNNLMDRIPFMWILCIIGFPAAALVAIFTGRN